MPVPQDEAAVSFTRRLNRQDAALDFRVAAQALAARIGALEGWPGSTFDHRAVTLKVGAAQAEAASVEVSPGTILDADSNGVRVACGEGILVLQRLQRPGGKMMPVGEFLAGHPLITGEVLPSTPMPPLVSPTPFPRPPKV